MTSHWTKPAAEAGGTLTRGDLFAAMEAIRRQKPQRQFIITSPSVIEQGRGDAEACCAVALWAHSELKRLPWWRFLQRRRLLALFDERAEIAESLWSMFGVEG